VRPLLVLLTACNFGNGGGAAGGDDAPIDARAPGDGSLKGTVFDPAITNVTVEIDYEAGHEPFTGNIVGFGDTFDITTTNIGRLFAGKKMVAIPRTTAGMQSIGAVADEQLTVSDLLALATTHRMGKDSASEKTYYVLFVSGYFTDANGPNNAVLGVSIGNTGVIAMFKDVVRSSSGISNIQRYVEQSTLVHELGHAIGLVNNGVALASPHHDADHGAHCTNESCVMYWQNEGASAMAAWATQFVLTSNTILFKPECLGDVDALTGGP
jgi:predicted Zn-dependent protease